MIILGWRNPRLQSNTIFNQPNLPRYETPTTFNPLDSCHSCDHSSTDHFKQFQGQGLTVSELNRLLSIIVDVENLFMCVHKERDPEVKQVYIYLFKVQIHKDWCTLIRTKHSSFLPLRASVFIYNSIVWVASRLGYCTSKCFPLKIMVTKNSNDGDNKTPACNHSSTYVKTYTISYKHLQYSHVLYYWLYFCKKNQIDLAED